MHRILLTLCAINGFLSVLLGAFGAHGLKSQLASASDAARRLDWWETASTYHLFHALAIGLAAALAVRAPGRLVALAGGAFFSGIFLFSGSLYAMSLTGSTGLGMVTPLGGLFLLGGWLALAIAAWRQPFPDRP